MMALNGTTNVWRLLFSLPLFASMISKSNATSVTIAHVSTFFFLLFFKFFLLGIRVQHS